MLGILSPRVMEFESKSYGVLVRELWSLSQRVSEFQSESKRVMGWNLSL